ncbi:GAF sensor signal transduction histidine kinase [Trichormus variabilis ATCC 29413]|uniref:histidine kinase n=2 Tax=Anabaena variabilis TaxID=264691 RepID=Q3MAP0_TRIV2|nr:MULTISPECIES: GAF domain-containing sensor histidine kinase [Nostocaceae]ABA21946.1 GAF sensor signal transduction histidine kinase [Trichormus variabilis ATCC 29413]MBC1215569.1 GAF domain-containing sensor histidine kinase [Trichormus variabilis ARAD]MBC1255101.1 GAF domain-containing sensor histidine kinase [Trichormus variabilis V5]MBC1267594.1 GAF domain-containing sensor histidine kinase [Trichormus variabilis FSR]MBC1303564.1 GAF domain-containing sensor histidine kinase [Trichormus 
MVEPENKLFALKDGWVSQDTREQQRLKALSELGLRQLETIPVFEEATQTAAHFLEAPISILGFIDQERHWFKSAVGLSRLGLMNHLAQSRQLLRQESFCTQVVDSHQILVINDTLRVTDPALATGKLIQDYGIRAYLGAPLIDAAGNCLGALAVMDLVPRNFTNRDVEFLQIIARWSMSEFERNRLLMQVKSEQISFKSAPTFIPHDEPLETQLTPPHVEVEQDSHSTKQVKIELLAQLTQELRTPLTSVLGMASVLGREIYGPLTTKQREYLDIIQHSGRYLLSLVNEITELGAIDEKANVLNVTPVDIEMLCQQAINTLEEAANRREQDIRLSIEPGRSRIWPLDKDKVRQMLYHLIFSVIQFSATGSIVRIHVSYKENALNITVWVSHPWLGDGITDVDPYFRLNSLSVMDLAADAATYSVPPEPKEETRSLPVTLEKLRSLADSYSDLLAVNPDGDSSKSKGNLSRESLGLLLSCQLAELHGGQISIQGSRESGHRYLVNLPLQLAKAPEVSDI